MVFSFDVAVLTVIIRIIFTTFLYWDYFSLITFSFIRLWPDILIMLQDREENFKGLGIVQS